MVRTQIQLPEYLYKEVKRISAERELSLAELTRRGLEYVVSVYLPKEAAKTGKWTLPAPVNLGGPPLAPVNSWRELANDSVSVPVIKAVKEKGK